MEIGEAIRKLRIKKGIRQNELAKRVGITQATLCYIEKGCNYPSKKNLYKICEELDTTPAILHLACVGEDDLPSGKSGIWPVFHMLRWYFGIDDML